MIQLLLLLGIQSQGTYALLDPSAVVVAFAAGKHEGRPASAVGGVYVGARSEQRA